MLTDEQVNVFIEDTLSLPNWREELKESKLLFLHKLENRFKHVMHYENLSWGAKSFEELQPPSVEECIHQCLIEGGGACLQLNYFLKLILEMIGYDVFVVGGQTQSMPESKTHLINIVRFPKSVPGVVSSPNNKSDSALYMVDVGFARPAPAIINLDELPHSYKCGGFVIQHRYNLELDRYERVLIGGDPIKGKFKSETEEYIDAYFDIIPRQFEDFKESMTRIFNDPQYSFFLNTTFLFKHISVQDHSQFEYISVRGRSITIGTPSDQQIMKFETYEEMFTYIEKYFPRISRATLRKAIENYKIRQSQYKSSIA